MRQPRTTIALFASMAFVAVMMGLLAGRACYEPKPRDVVQAPPHIAPVIEDAKPIVAAPIEPVDVVDAGDALPLVAITHDARDTRDTRDTRDDARQKLRPRRGDPRNDVPLVQDPDPPEAPRPPIAASAPVVDAGSPVVVFDAGVASAAKTPPPARDPELPSAPLVVMYRDELTWLKLVEMRVFLNGKRVVDDKPTDANRPARGERKLFETRVFPGHHQVRVETVYVGEDSGIFDYMSQVRVRMREMIVVEVDATKGARVMANAFDRGALQPWEKRPGLKLTQGN